MGRGRKRLRRKPAETFDLPVSPKSSVSPPIPELWPVPPEQVVAVWPIVEELLGSELELSDWTSESLRRACEFGQVLLWLVCDQNDEAIAAMVTSRDPYDRCVICICSGRNLFDFVEARHQLYDWAKANGMKEVRLYGRAALQKLMPECKRIGIILTKEL